MAVSAAEKARLLKVQQAAQAQIDKNKATIAALEAQQAAAAKAKADADALAKADKEEAVRLNAELRLDRIRLEQEAIRAQTKIKTAVFQMLGGILYFNGVPFNGTDSGKTYVNGLVTGTSKGGVTGLPEADTGLAIDTFRKTIGLIFGQAEASKPWVNSLYATATGFTNTGSTADEALNLSLQVARTDPNMKAFADRFSGIFKLQDLKASGVSVEIPTIEGYMKSQAAMADILNRSGLTSLANDTFTTDMIGKGIAVSTVAETITKVFDRIDTMPTETKNTINRYYPTADRAKLATALLTGTKGIAALEKEISGLEVLSAAEQQGIGANTIAGGITVDQATNISAGGTTFQGALTGFSQVARARGTEQKLAEISGQQSMGVSGLTDAIINKNAAQLTQIEKLSAEEDARFRGSAGRLASKSRAQGEF